MRIVKRMSPPDEKEITCSECKSVLAYLPSDVKQVYDDWAPCFMYVLTCPVCLRQIILDEVYVE